MNKYPTKADSDWNWNNFWLFVKIAVAMVLVDYYDMVKIPSIFLVLIVIIPIVRAVMYRNRRLKEVNDA